MNEDPDEKKKEKLDLTWIWRRRSRRRGHRKERSVYRGSLKKRAGSNTGCDSKDQQVGERERVGPRRKE